MSDEDESVSEDFSGSEDEWKPGKQKHDEVESSDDSDLNDSADLNRSGAKLDPPSRKRAIGKSQPRSCSDRGGVAKKRKPMGQSLRAKLYSKYRPPPKKFQTSNNGNNSPTASTSRAASKNEVTPDEVVYIDNDDSDSDVSSVGNHLVNPAELDLRSSFFNTDITRGKKAKKDSPIFDCNAGVDQISNSENEDNENSNKAFDFRNLLEKANCLERVKKAIRNRKAKSTITKSKENALDDVATLLALGENQNLKHDKGAKENDEDDTDQDGSTGKQRVPHKLNKTKSTRNKHKKTSGGKDTDDSDWEEVAEDESEEVHHRSLATGENLEIIVEQGKRKRTKDEKTQHELELAFKRRLNRDLKERQMLLHKASLLCLFSRSYNYNRILNDLSLMQSALNLLPGTKAYPRETGTEVKYFQSFVTWFKTVVKLTNPNLYPDNEKVGRTWADVKMHLMDQIKKKEARCKQDMIFIFVSLIRGMGLQCRLVINMQPLPLKPPQADLLPIKLKADDKKEKKIIKEKIENHLEKEKIIKKANQTDEKTTEKTTKNSEKSEKCNSSQKKQPDLSKLKSPIADKVIESEKSEKCISSQKKQPDLSKLKRPIDSKVTEAKKSRKAAANEFITKEDAVSVSDTRKLHQISLKSNLHNTKKKEVPEIVIESADAQQKRGTRGNSKAKTVQPTKQPNTRSRSRSVSPRPLISTEFLKKKRSPEPAAGTGENNKISEPKNNKSKNNEKPKKADAYENPVSASDSGIHLETSLNSNLHNPSDEKQQEQPEIVAKTGVAQEKRGTRGNSKSRTVISTVPAKKQPRSRSRSISPRPLISTEILKKKLSTEPAAEKYSNKQKSQPINKSNNVDDESKISTDFPKSSKPTASRVLRSRQNSNVKEAVKNILKIPQFDGADDDDLKMPSTAGAKRKQPKKSQKQDDGESDLDFEPSPPKQPKRAPVLPKTAQNLRKDRRVLSTDNETDSGSSSSSAKKAQAADMWVEVWSDVENEWICIDLFKGKLNSVLSIRQSASSSLAYVFAFQNDLSLKDVTARYCQHWSTIVRKNRVDRTWLETAISHYHPHRTDRDIREDHEMRRIHEQKPLPTSICDFKDHPLYALERHLLKFQAIYPPNPPTLGFTKTKEPIYSRDCVHTLHSRDIWLKQARTVKLGEQPYKIVKARPKWDRLTQTVIKDQPLEIFGFWQTEDYEPPTAENGIVPRNAYGNVELFKECMLPKKTVHLRLNGLNRICKKLNIDCANAMVGFDFHQGACHPVYDGFVICEEFADQVTAAWYQDQEDQDRKEQEKYEARVYGNWKKLIKGLIIRERIKKKYNI